MSLFSWGVVDSSDKFGFIPKYQRTAITVPMMVAIVPIFSKLMLFTSRFAIRDHRSNPLIADEALSQTYTSRFILTYDHLSKLLRILSSRQASSFEPYHSR